VVLSLCFFFFDRGPRVRRFEHSRCADVSILAPSLQKLLAHSTQLRPFFINLPYHQEVGLWVGAALGQRENARTLEVFGKGNAEVRIVEETEVLRPRTVRDAHLSGLHCEIGLSEASALDELVDYVASAGGAFFCGISIARQQSIQRTYTAEHAQARSGGCRRREGCA
jgi:hypothetical protein